MLAKLTFFLEDESGATRRSDLQMLEGGDDSCRSAKLTASWRAGSGPCVIVSISAAGAVVEKASAKLPRGPVNTRFARN